MISNYLIAVGATLPKLEERVRTLIRQGWEPTGGLVVVGDATKGYSVGGATFTQAMVTHGPQGGTE